LIELGNARLKVEFADRNEVTICFSDYSGFSDLIIEKSLVAK